MSVVLGWLIPFLPLIWSFASKGLPKLVPAILSVAGRAGIIGTICAILAKILKFFLRFPAWISGVFKGAGVFGAIFTAIRFILNLTLRFPVIMGLSLLLSQYFPNILEKIFLVVGAVGVKIALVFVKWGKGFIDNLSQNNTQELNEILGNTVDSLPPCIVDVMGYMHFVEDVGLIISTAVFIGIYNLVTYFFMRYRG